MSVVVTESKELAETIHALARSCEARKTSAYSINGGWRVLRRHKAKAPSETSSLLSGSLLNQLRAPDPWNLGLVQRLLADDDPPTF